MQIPLSIRDQWGDATALLVFLFFCLSFLLLPSPPPPVSLLLLLLLSLLKWDVWIRESSMCMYICVHALLEVWWRNPLTLGVTAPHLLDESRLHAGSWKRGGSVRVYVCVCASVWLSDPVCQWAPHNSDFAKTRCLPESDTEGHYWILSFFLFSYYCSCKLALKNAGHYLQSTVESYDCTWNVVYFASVLF